ncbi:polycomb group protein EMBRYONIC FLOWER 2 [Artemisia annua]|uniref:Polycomb group protein EMBRYONIC FLOWER 2 n=1 Tax=Artemisia annua TaxID=35608 RepID=A0A2U1KFR3_ARTAN|nr:polycomb group protein EMBRYONIC FLOWER 2 [Artemisia annua]
MAAVSFYIFEETRPPESYVTEKGCIIVHSISNNIILTRNPAESSLPVQLSAEQEGAARQSLKVYCQPIKYYNILHDHALDKLLLPEFTFLTSFSVNKPHFFLIVMEDYSCAICLIKCASFKGLKCHPKALHDLFHYEFQFGYFHVNGFTPEEEEEVRRENAWGFGSEILLLINLPELPGRPIRATSTTDVKLYHDSPCFCITQTSLLGSL